MSMTLMTNGGVDAQTVASVAALVGILGTIGGAFFFIGRLTGKFEGLDKKVDAGQARMLSDQDKCMVQRGNVEANLFGAVGELKVGQEGVKTHLENLKEAVEELKAVGH